MNNEIYKTMILECPIPYVYIEGFELNKEKYYKIIEINDAFSELIKIKKDNIINSLVTDLFPKIVIYKLESHFKKVNENKYVRYEWCEFDSNYYNVEVFVNEKNKYFIRFIKINETFNKLSNILRKSPFVSWIKGLDGRYLDVNDEFLKVMNKDYEEVIGKTCEDIWGKEKSKELKKQDLEVIEKRELLMFDDDLSISSKESRKCETTKWPYTNNKKVEGIIGISIDVTDKLKLKELIETSEQNFLDMANNIDEVILIINKNRALYVSPYFEQLCGFKPDALYEDINNWYSYWDHIEFVEDIVDYEYKDIYTNLIRIVKNNKIDKWITCKFIPIFDEKGNIVRKIGLLKDVTDKKKIDEELENLRMEFFSNLSHELRTPINLITSSLQLIDLKLDKKCENTISKYLNIIAQNNLRLLKLVNNLIDSTKINSGSFSYNPQNKDIISFVEDITESVVAFVEKNNLEITFDTNVEEKIVSFDLNHIERIILNLISNAIKFNKPGGRIEVKIYVSDDIKIIVKDTGIGIPKNKVEKVFDRFEQVSKHNRREREGSGIGLSLVKSLVEMHGGNITLSSILNEGSEFIITLPNTITYNNEKIGDSKDGFMNQVNKMEVEFSDIYC